MRKTLSLGLLLLAALPAMAQDAADPQTLFSLPLTAFKASDRDASQRLYRAPDAQLNAYKSIVVEPLYFMRHQPDGDWQLLQSGEENRIAAYFQRRMTEELHKVGIPVSREALPDSARLRVAVTGMAQERPGVEPLDILPIKAVFNLGRLAAGKEPYLTKVASMGQLEDANNGKLLAGSVNLRKSDKSRQRGEPVKLESLESLIDDWCRDSAKLLARGMAVKPGQP
ncbi:MULTISPECIES: DUF3313 domain-containing protein [Chromobacterium]|uniref:DUF3313 domain-containing protein n=2 Tax=Chromobacterium TaxID=535 RepID=A0AAD0RWM0_9NEIS|nr:MULTISPECIES: DUF3313 domain-containing protein [Chromobacterium]AXT45778.1 DUF3313 domain-containing protein [Chromobacterium rhizoryzae]PTU68900.1 DUF3313 domain-containing protein [Chromobacterium haemolyticum]BBH12079.1 hypothetical protein CH06BL_13270 [Chromobacterium haemolyticum]